MVNKIIIKSITADGIKELKEIVNSYEKDNKELFEQCNKEQKEQLRDKFCKLFNLCMKYYLEKIETEYDEEIENINEQKLEMISQKNNAMEEFLNRISKINTKKL